MTSVDAIVTDLVNGEPVADSIRQHAEETKSPIADVAHAFLDERLTYSEADAAANQLWMFMQSADAIPDLAYAVFDAFDQGEYHHAPGDDPIVVYTLPKLRAALGHDT